MHFVSAMTCGDVPMIMARCKSNALLGQSQQCDQRRCIHNPVGRRCYWTRLGGPAEQRLLGGQISLVHTAVRGQQGCWSHTVIMDTVTTHTLPLDNSVLVWQKDQQMVLFLRRSCRQAQAVMNVPRDVPHVQSLPTVSNSTPLGDGPGDLDTTSDTGGSQTSSTTPSFHSSSQTPQQHLQSPSSGRKSPT